MNLPATIMISLYYVARRNDVRRGMKALYVHHNGRPPFGLGIRRGMKLATRFVSRRSTAERAQ